MWLYLAISSALALGVYDFVKKRSLIGNAVLPVLFLNTLICALIFSVLLFFADDKLRSFEDSSLHFKVFIKAVIVLLSWILGYFGIKHVPLTIAGPINATRPVIVLLGALLVFGERLNLLQWSGVAVSIIAFWLLSQSGKREGIDFKKDKWIFMMVGAAITGAASGLYDKYLLKSIDPLFVQTWFSLYQFVIMVPIIGLMWYPSRNNTTPFKWRWSIILIPLFLVLSDYLYFNSLSIDGSMVSVVSMIRRSSVLISFIFAVIFLGERNVKSKLVDLLLMIIGLVLIYFGTIK